MIFEILAVSGSIWVGKRIFDNLTETRSRSNRRGPLGEPNVSFVGRSTTMQRKPSVRGPDEPLSAGERTACRNFAVAGSGLTLATAGALGAAQPLTLLAHPVLGAAFLPLAGQGGSILWRERRISYGLFLAAVGAGCLLTGHVVLTGLLEAVYFGSEVLVARTRRETRDKMKGILDNCPAEAWVRRGDAEQAVPIVELVRGDVVVVRAGEPIPVDGTVVSGGGGVDQSMMTGESVVAERTIGDEVFASTLLLNGTLDIRVDRSGREALAGQIGDVLDRMGSFEESVEQRGVKIADASVAPALAASVLGWAARGPMTALTISASNFADTERLTSPLSILNYLRIAAEAGVRVKDGRSLELLSDVDTVVFDKTGTLTFERLNVVQVLAAYDWNQYEVLALAAAAEERQHHPVAAAIREAAASLPLEIPDGVTVTNSLGNGIVARVDGQTVLVGSRRFLTREGISIPADAEGEEDAALDMGRTVVHVACDNDWVGQITLQSMLRPSAPAVISLLRSHGCSTAVVSGDREGPTRRLASALGVDTWRAELLPHEKMEFIKGLQAAGRTVCFVGDGINDGMALKTANVSVTLGDASLVVTDTAQIVLKQGSLAQLPQVFEMSNQLRSDQRMIRTTMVLGSALSAGGVLLFGLPLPFALTMYLGTIVTAGMVAASPLIGLASRRETPPRLVRPMDTEETLAW